MKNKDKIKKKSVAFDSIYSTNKFRDFNKELVSIYRLHSSKFHSRKVEKNRDMNDKFNEEMNLLVKAEKEDRKLNIWNEPIINKIQNNYKNVFEFRKKMAFRFRYMNYSPRNISNKQNFKLKDEKMNKILKISKSIPNYLLRNPNSVQNINTFGNTIVENDVGINLKREYKEDNKKREYGFISPFKLNRYIGNLYDYYRSNYSMNENKLIFNNNNVIIDKNDAMSDEIRSHRNKNENNSIKRNIENIKKNKIIKLNSLLL